MHAEAAERCWSTRFTTRRRRTPRAQRPLRCFTRNWAITTKRFAFSTARSTIAIRASFTWACPRSGMICASIRGLTGGSRAWDSRDSEACSLAIDNPHLGFCNAALIPSPQSLSPQSLISVGSRITYNSAPPLPRQEMSLAPGARLGPYEIISAIGAGGMGEVYRARDARLGRDVAVKILPDLFAADADRVARFQREAQVLASLNHPHIAQIYGVEQHAGSSALVLELVDGPTLADVIAGRSAAPGSKLPRHKAPSESATWQAGG